MTCIVGVLGSDGKVYIAGDSVGSDNNGGHVSSLKTRKVFKKDDKMIIGYTHSYRMGQLVQYGLTLPADCYDDPLEYMVKSFIPALRKCFTDNGYIEKKDEQEKGGCFLVGYRHRLFQVQEDFSVVEVDCGYDAVGSGTKYALGSLYTRPLLGCNLESGVITALEAASYFDGKVGPPFWVESL